MTVRFARRLCASPYHARRVYSHTHSKCVRVCAHGVSREFYSYAACHVSHVAVLTQECSEPSWYVLSTCTSQMPKKISEHLFFKIFPGEHTPIPP